MSSKILPQIKYRQAFETYSTHRSSFSFAGLRTFASQKRPKPPGIFPVRSELLLHKSGQSRRVSSRFVQNFCFTKAAKAAGYLPGSFRIFASQNRLKPPSTFSVHYEVALFHALDSTWTVSPLIVSPQFRDSNPYPCGSLTYRNS